MSFALAVSSYPEFNEKVGAIAMGSVPSWAVAAWAVSSTTTDSSIIQVARFPGALSPAPASAHRISSAASDLRAHGRDGFPILTHALGMAAGYERRWSIRFPRFRVRPGIRVLLLGALRVGDGRRIFLRPVNHRRIMFVRDCRAAGRPPFMLA